LLALDESLELLTPTVRAQAWIRWLPAIVSGRRHVVARAFGAASSALMVLEPPQVRRSSAR
jgi:hypothetical protein